jgi:hypothetical protein
MKRIDVTRPVMEKVVRFEEQRTKQWILLFVLGVACIAALVGVSVFRTYTMLQERHTLDLFEILHQDREIIAEFATDTLFVAFEELPQRTMLFSVGLLILLVGIWIITRRRRKIIKRRLVEISKRRTV